MSGNQEQINNNEGVKENMSPPSTPRNQVYTMAEIEGDQSRTWAPKRPSREPNNRVLNTCANRRIESDF